MSKFTVRWEAQSDADSKECEIAVTHIFPADSVIALYATTKDGHWPYEAALRMGYNRPSHGVEVYLNGEAAWFLNHGTVYVMNEQGKTVATYRFSPWP